MKYGDTCLTKKRVRNVGPTKNKGRQRRSGKEEGLAKVVKVRAENFYRDVTSFGLFIEILLVLV